MTKKVFLAGCYRADKVFFMEKILNEICKKTKLTKDDIWFAGKDFAPSFTQNNISDLRKMTHAIKTSDFLIGVIHPRFEAMTSGTATEIGIAMGKNLPIFLFYSNYEKTECGDDLSALMGLDINAFYFQATNYGENMTRSLKGLIKKVKTHLGEND